MAPRAGVGKASAHALQRGFAQVYWLRAGTLVRRHE